jgi:transcriptional regulator with XRE-family HTH domain
MIGTMQKSVHTPEYRSLRAELSSARRSAGLSQRELALRLKVPHSWIAKVENGERRIDAIECCWFFAACGVDPLVPFAKLTETVTKSNSPKAVKGAR